MNARVEKRVEEWPTRPFERGYSGLRDLAGEQFSGVVDAGSAWLCMLNGSVVGVFDGEIEAFEDAEGTAYEAPHESVPLLFAMQERGGSLEEQYYTKDTPISEAVQTLSSGTFTGYIELSENVLSGDYYVLFHGGRSMSVAYVGSSERKDLVTDEEALDRADDEVGIYDVYSVDVDVVEIPGDVAEGAAGATDEEATDAGETEAEVGAAAAGGGVDPASEANDPGERSDTGPPVADSDANRTTASDDPIAGDPEQTTASDDPIAGDPADTTEYGSSTGTGDAAGGNDPLASDPSVQDDRDGGEGAGSTGAETDQADPAGHGDADPAGHGDAGPADRNENGAGRSESGDPRPENDATRPESGDPRPESGTENGDPGRRSGGQAGPGKEKGDTEPRSDTTGRSRSAERTQSRSGPPDRRQERANAPDGQTSSPDRRPGDRDERAPAGQDSGRGERRDRSPYDEENARRANRSTPSVADTGPDEEDVEELRAAIRDHEAAIDRLRDRLSGVEQDRDAGEAERDRLRAEIDDLAADMSDLRRTVLRVDENLDRLEERVSDRLDELSERSRTGGGRSRPPTDRGADPEEGRRPTEERTPRSNPGADRGTGADAPATGRKTGGGRSGSPAGRGDEGQFDREITPEEAMTGSRILVRYGSQGKPTLKSVHAGDAEKQAVNDNLRLDIHTNFEAEGAGVEGEPFDEWLPSRIEYRFAEWLVRELVYEIRDTGNADALADLYDAIPEIDHVELAGTVEILEGDSEEAADAVNFDVVARDARGTPLVVANFNDDRQPADQSMVVELQERAATLREHGPLTAAFLVTSSYFEAIARETAEQATSGSLLSRDSKKSFVKLSRKRGFHLCLVESRDEDFHLNVPEL